METFNNEPVSVMGALNTALVATWGVIVILADLEPNIAGGVTVAIAAWVGFAAKLVRSRVTPVE